MIKSNYKTVRRVLKILHNDARILSDEAINQRIEKVKKEAIQTAKDIGIKSKNLKIETFYYPDFPPMDYPVGPTKSPESWRECLNMYFSVPCVVSFVISDKVEEDELDKIWWTEKVSECRKLVKKFGKSRGLIEFQKTGNWAKNVMNRISKKL